MVPSVPLVAAAAAVTVAAAAADDETVSVAMVVTSEGVVDVAFGAILRKPDWLKKKKRNVARRMRDSITKFVSLCYTR